MNEHLEHARKWLNLPDVSLDELVSAAREISAPTWFYPVEFIAAPAASYMTFVGEHDDRRAVSTAALRDVILSRRKEDAMAQPDREVTPRPDYIPALGVLRAMLDGLSSITDVLIVYDEVAVQSGRLNDISYLMGAYRSVHALRIDSDVGPAYHGEPADLLVDLTEKGYYAPYKGRFRVNKALTDKHTIMRWDAQLGCWRHEWVERVALPATPDVFRIKAISSSVVDSGEPNRSLPAVVDEHALMADFFATSEHDRHARETEPDWRQLRDLLPDSKYLRVGLLGWEFSCIQLDGVVWCAVMTDAGNRTAPMKATDLRASVPAFDCPAAWWAERVSDAQRAQRLIDAAIPTLPRVPRKS